MVNEDDFKVADIVFAFNNTSTVSTGVALDAEWVVTDPVGAISSYTGDVLDLGNVAPGLYDLALSVEGTGGCSDDDLVATVEVLEALIPVLRGQDRALAGARGEDRIGPSDALPTRPTRSLL